MKLIDNLITKEEDIIQPTGSLILEEISEDAHILGASPIQLPEIKKNGIWWDIEITPEIQKVLDNRDMYNCVNNAWTNDLELLLKFLYGIEVNLSELYSAKDSGTIPGRGNSFENVFEVGRKNFCAWEDEFPTERDKSVEYNYAKEISDGLRKKVEERGKGYIIRYQFIKYLNDFYLNKGLKVSPITVAVEGRYVWKNGVIVNSGSGYNHAVVYLGEKNGAKIVLDSESLQVLPFSKDYQFSSPAVHSITKKNMVTTYKKHGDPTICLKVSGEDSMIAFADGIIEGGKLLKTLYNIENYKDLPRTYVTEWPHPISYWITSTEPNTLEGRTWSVKETKYLPKSIWELIKNIFNK